MSEQQPLRTEPLGAWAYLSSLSSTTLMLSDYGLPVQPNPAALRRFVAAWNACRGIPLERLEATAGHLENAAAEEKFGGAMEG